MRKSEATKYRGILRDAKKGESPNRLIEKARRLKDPYFASLALFDLSGMPKIETEKALQIALEAVKTAGRVEAGWRRAEVLGMIAKKAGSWGGKEAGGGREQVLDRVLKGVGAMPEGKGLADAIAGCAAHIGCWRLGALLKKAVSNRGFEMEGVKAVIRAWATGCGGEGMGVKDLMRMLLDVKDIQMRARLLGYLHLQGKKARINFGKASPLRAAVEAVAGAPEDGRLEVLRYLAGKSTDRGEMEIVAGGAGGLGEPSSRARLLAALGAGADRMGEKAMALEFFSEGLRIGSQIKDTKEKAKIHQNLTKGLERLGGKKEDKAGEREVKKPMEKVKKKKTGEGHVLALYDTYEGGLGPVHTRAVARAAPLCAAFGLDLALIGFPAKGLDEIVKLVSSDTKVGEGKKYLGELAGEGRVLLVPCRKNAAPENWDKLGLPVATTPHPSKEKKVTMEKAVELAVSLHPQKRACVIMGLGKRGLPGPLLGSVPYHLEITGESVSLETATAMGVIASQMARKRF